MMISILIPMFNEQENAKRIVPELIPIMDNLREAYEILIIDDGSTDRTVEEAKKIIRKTRNIRLIQHQKNKGLGCAVRTGINEAKGDIIIALDADFTFHPRQIPNLVKEYKKTNADCVIGSHLLKEGNAKDVIGYRLLLSKIVNIMYRILLAKKITSISSIFRLYKAESVKELNLISTGFNINAEILFKLIKKKKNVREIPAELTTRIYGKSKLDTRKEILNHLKLLSNILGWKLGLKN